MEGEAVLPLHRAHSWPSLISMKLAAKLREPGPSMAAETVAFLALPRPLVGFGMTLSSSLFLGLEEKAGLFHLWRQLSQPKY